MIDEGDLAAYLGTNIEKLEKNKLKISQTYLISRILEALNLHKEYKKYNTSTNTILHKYKESKNRIHT